MTSLFIVLEGIDATGKTHLTDLNTRSLPGSTRTREPYCDSIRCEVIEQAEEMDKLILFARDRLTHNSLIDYWLQTGDVVCDRYWLSNVAYQGISLSYQTVMAYQPSNNIKPDLLIYLTAPLEVIRSRMETRGESHLDRQTYEKLISGYETAIRNVNNQFRKPINRRPGHKCQVLRLDGAGDMDENLKKSLGMIEKVRGEVE